MAYRLFSKKIVIIVLILLSPLFLVMSFNTQTNSPPKQSIIMDLNAEKYEFTPNKITVPYNTNLTLILHSKDTIHGFYLEGYDLKQTICNEHYFTLSFITNKVGTFIFKCNEPACGPYHPYMIGSLTVTPDRQLSLQYVVITFALLVVTSIFIVKWRKSSGQ